jgi:hypothetical protein
MKKFLLLALVLAGGVAVYLYWNRPQENTPESGAVVTNLATSVEKTNATNGDPIAPPVLPPNGLVTTDTNAAPATNASPEASNDGPHAVMLPADTNAPADLPPLSVLENTRRAVRQYGQMFGGDPVGTNPEITAALTGKNPKHINFLTGLPGTRINDQGEMVDAWGTPYFFHQISGSEMEIHSAGPDKVMWTSDDLVVK